MNWNIVYLTERPLLGISCTIDYLELVMPRYATLGGDVILVCNHSVPPEQLYKVEWRKGDRKIFQYIKGRKPPFRYFTAAGVVPNRIISNPCMSSKSRSVDPLKRFSRYKSIVAASPGGVFIKSTACLDISLTKDKTRIDAKGALKEIERVITFLLRAVEKEISYFLRKGIIIHVKK
ncbi:unnamed protein product [Phaedon cochleariae]|uniref:Uncharacterized protein n=1 Tax=Phaedon cochleariae TaxID=80249 RepID=A0A9N9WZR3_PHACE|nr:unnamed protein product [Phaedon cochleariae]